MKLFHTAAYGEAVALGEGVSMRLVDAGHMLGSAYAEFTASEGGKAQKVLFSGDLGNRNQPILNDPTPMYDADFVVCESTYGGRNHSYKSESDKFLAAILATLDRKGTVLIPSFAVGRTQEILYEINRFKENGLLGRHRDVRVIVDSPLAIRATEVFRKYYHEFDEEARALIESGDDPLNFKNLEFSLTAETSKLLNTDDSPKIIISASGMADAGRIRHHIKHNIYKKNCAIVFVGYQAEGSLGKLLLEGAKDIKLFGERITVNATIYSIDHFSAHADHNMLVEWITGIKNKMLTILVHGEPEAQAALKDALDARGERVEIAKFMTTIELDEQHASEFVPAATTPVLSSDGYRESLVRLTVRIAELLTREDLAVEAGDLSKVRLFLESAEDYLSK
jgi:metallo-beta-lactamase family protein